MIVAGYVSVGLGKDANWDLQNYHFYNAYAMLEGRLGWDLAPAQIQTFHNPLADLPFYLMVRADWAPRVISVVLALPAGIGAYFLALVIGLLFPGDFRRQWLLRAAALTIGCTGTMAIAMLGTTMNEWPGAALVVIALWLLLLDADGSERPFRRLALAGVIAGAASGLKLTAAPYAVGLCCALVSQRAPVRRSLRDAVVFVVAVVVGLLLTSGFWFYEMWRRFGNPVFPYFNHWFRSPWWEDTNIPYRDYGPHSISELLAMPFRLLETHALFITETYFRDWRPAILCISALLMLTATIYRRLARRKASASGQDGAGSAQQAGAWRFVGVFWVVSLAIWVLQYSIYRYAIPLELLTGPLIVGLLQRSVSQPWVRGAAVALASALAIFTAEYPDWGRISFHHHYFTVDAPALPEHSLVILVGEQPMSYVIPFLREDARFVGLHNTLTNLAFRNRYTRDVAEAIDGHRGPLFSMSWEQPDVASILATRGLRQDRDRCVQIRSNMRTSPIELCPLLRTGPEGAHGRSQFPTARLRILDPDASSIPASVGTPGFEATGSSSTAPSFASPEPCSLIAATGP